MKTQPVIGQANLATYLLLRRLDRVQRSRHADECPRPNRRREATLEVRVLLGCMAGMAFAAAILAVAAAALN